MTVTDMDDISSSKSRSKISRRSFLKIGAAATATISAAVAIDKIRLPGGVHNLAAVQAEGSIDEQIVKTTCAMCPSGCGLEVRVVNGRAVKVEGNAVHPLNQGVCCLKGQCSLEALYSPERIRHPRIQLGERGSGDWKEISWDEALALVTEKLSALRSADLAHTFALMHGETRGQMRSFLKRFMEAYGSPNLIARENGDGPARLAMLLSQGINGLPVYDINNAGFVMTFGGNLLEGSRNVISHLGSVAFLHRGRSQRGKLVAVHPRLSITGTKADEWIPIRPGTYAALAMGMANVIINSNLYDEAFVRDYTFGFEDFADEAGIQHMGFKRLVLEQYPLDRVATITGVRTEIIARLAGEFASNRPSIAVLPTEAGELNSGNSLYTALAVHSLNALVGSIDRAGGVLVQRFPTVKDWPAVDLDTTAEAGLAYERIDGAGAGDYPLAASTYHRTADRILSEEPYPTNALFLYNCNPVYEYPGEGNFVKALMKVPFVASFSSVLDESAAHSDLILPASSFLEVWGDDYLEGTGYAGVSLRQPVVEEVHDTREPGDVLLEVAARLGSPMASALPWKSYKDLLEYRHSSIDMDPEKYQANGFWAELVYFHAEPGSPAWSDVVGRDRLKAPKDGRFDFFSRELYMLFGNRSSNGTADQEVLDLACLPHFEVPSMLHTNGAEADEYPLLLISQPLITQVNTWQGILPSLQEMYGLQNNARWESWVEVNPKIAEAMHVKDGDLVWVESPHGKVQVPVRIYPGIWPNAVFMPGGLGHRSLVKWGRGAPSSMTVGTNANSLARAESEPVTGQAVINPIRVKIWR